MLDPVAMVDQHRVWTDRHAGLGLLCCLETLLLYFCCKNSRDVHYALRVITGNVDEPCVMWIFRGNNVPYFCGASLVLLGLEG